MSVHRKEVPVLLRKPKSAEVGNSDLDKQGFSRSHTLNIVCYMFKVNFIIIHVYILTTNTACTLFRCATVLWLISVPILLPSSPKWSLNFKLDSYSSFCMNVWQLHTSGAVSQHSLWTASTAYFYYPYSHFHFHYCCK